VRKIWANGKLIYNVADTADIDTLSASLEGIASVTFYTGSETQTANSLIQASVGIANTPAYRGTAYVVFESLQLEEYGNRTPNLEFEVIVGGTVSHISSSALVIAEPSAVAYAIAYGPGKFSSLGKTGGAGWATTTLTGTNWSPLASVSMSGVPNQMISAFGKYYSAMQSSDWIKSSTDGLNWVSESVNYSVQGTSICYDKSARALFAPGYDSPLFCAITRNGMSWSYETMPDATYYSSIAAGNGIVVALELSPPSAAVRTSGGAWIKVSIPIATPHCVVFGDSLFMVFGDNEIATSENGLDWTITATPSFSPIAAAFGDSWFCSIGTSGGVASVLMTRDGVATVQSPLTVGHSMMSICYGPGYFLACGYITGSSIVFTKIRAAEVVTASSSPTVASIVTDICESGGLAAGDIDVTALSATVAGYAKPRHYQVIFSS
jgi:hypothetical protein